MRRFLTVLTVMLAGGLLTACGDDSDAMGTGGTTSIFGTYTLQTINGSSLPFVIIQVGNDKVEITAGSVRLNSDNTFSVSLTLRATTAGTVTTQTETGTGTFTVTGSSVRLTDQGGEITTGSITGNTLTIIDPGVTFVFTK